MGIRVARKALYPGALCEFTPFSNMSVSNLLLQMAPLAACCFCQYWPGSSWHALSFSHSVSFSLLWVWVVTLCWGWQEG